MNLFFGAHRGKDLTVVPDAYLMWLTNAENLNQQYWKPGKKEFKVSDEIALAARRELERRGFKRKGSHWE